MQIVNIMDYRKCGQCFEFYYNALHYNHINLKNSVRFNLNILAIVTDMPKISLRFYLFSYDIHTNYSWKAI